MKPIEIQSLVFCNEVFEAVHKNLKRTGELRQTFVFDKDDDSVEYEIRITRVNGKRLPLNYFKGAPRPNGRR